MLTSRRLIAAATTIAMVGVTGFAPANAPAQAAAPPGWQLLYSENFTTALNTNPLFRTASPLAPADVRLRPGSPAFGAGTGLGFAGFLQLGLAGSGSSGISRTRSCRK